MRRLLLTLSWLTIGCGTVPDLIFADYDGAIGDGASDASDATTIDSSTTPDAASGCPAQVPPYASACCGPIACLGVNCAATCGDCVLKCSPLNLCCPTASNKAVCRASNVCN